MKQRELARLHVLNNVLEYQIPIAQAAEILGVTERHARGLLNAYRKEGAVALAHVATGAVGLTTLSWILRLTQWCGRPAAGTSPPIARWLGRPDDHQEDPNHS